MPRRILLLITDLDIGGTPTVVRELAIRLNDPPDVHIEVACLKRRGPVADQIEAAGVPVTAFDASRVWHLPATVRRLRELVGQRNIDTVFSFLIHANTVAAIASRELPEVRFLQSIQTVQERPRWHWWMQRGIRTRAERIVVPSTAVAEVAEQHCRVPREQSVVIPNAVDPSDFPRVEVFAGPQIRAGYLGRLDPAKSPGTLIESFDFAPPPEAELHYFGDGPLRPWLEREVDLFKLNGRVFFHGAVARPQDALKRMDMLWLPSWSEGFGMVLIEAMASGIPVVACDEGGVKDIVRDGHNGFLAGSDEFHYRRFTWALWKMRDDAELRRKIIENGLVTVREKFSWEVVLPRYRELLRI